MAPERSIVVYGAGAVGGYLGGKLAGGASGAGVTLVGRAGVVEAVQRHGLILQDGQTELVAHPAAVSTSAGLPPCDLVILTVRAYDVASSIPDVRALLGETGLVLAMQNGVGSEELLAEALGRERVLPGTLTVSAGMEEPGIITRYSRQGGVALSSMDSAPIPPWIATALEASGLTVVAVGDYRSVRWSKLLLNMLGAATTAILDVDMTALMAQASLFRLEQLAMREAGRVMDALRIQTVALPGYQVPLLRLIMRLPRPLAQQALGPRIAGARGGRAPTMRADVTRGRSEAGFLNGAVAQAAARLGRPAPVNAALTELIEEVTRDPERRAAFRGRPEALLGFMAERGIRV